VAERVLAVDARLERRAGDGRFLDVRFDAPPGVTVVFGPSGAGKSTLLAIVAGLLAPSSGRIALGERVLYDSERGISVPSHHRKLALVFQSLALFPHMSVGDNVRYGVPKSHPAEKRDELQKEWCRRMHVEHVVARRPATLSGGEAQRVALARALASEPEALLLDEPFTALDSTLRTELGRELESVVGDLALPVVLVTHDKDAARLLGDRAVGLESGRVTRAGSVAEVLGED
jgi:molybdate transport system ATP-binding protein